MEMNLSAAFLILLVAQCTGKALTKNETDVPSTESPESPESAEFAEVAETVITTFVATPSSEMIIPMEGIPIIESDLSFRQASTLSTVSVSESNFYIQSTGNPATIPLGSQYRWDIKKNSSAVCRLRIQYDSFDITAAKMCSGDVMIIETNGQSVSQCGLKTGQILFLNFPADQEVVTILFNDDGKGRNNPPLQLLITQDITGCAGSGVTSNKVFYLESKDFRTSLTYEANLNQTYTVVRNSSDVCQLTLEFKTFELQPAINRVCDHDYLEYSDHGVNIRQCGTIADDTTRTVTWPKSQANYYFSFVTDATVSARGFSVLVTQVPGSC